MSGSARLSAKPTTTSKVIGRSRAVSVKILVTWVKWLRPRIRSPFVTQDEPMFERLCLQLESPPAATWQSPSPSSSGSWSQPIFQPGRTLLWIVPWASPPATRAKFLVHVIPVLQYVSAESSEEVTQQARRLVQDAGCEGMVHQEILSGDQVWPCYRNK